MFQLYGRASDIVGRPKTYLFSLSVFALGCLWCGSSSSLRELVMARAFCGIGGEVQIPIDARSNSVK